MKLSDNFRKDDEVSLEARFCENKTKNITTGNLKNFRKVSREFSVIYLQTADNSHLNKYPTILVPHFSKVYL